MSRASPPYARFDDLRAGRASELTRPVAVLVAQTCEEVRQVLQEAEQAVAKGLWAAGFISYEAASGLDPHLVTKDRLSGPSWSELPLVWFALFEELSEPGVLKRRASDQANYRLGAFRTDTTRDEYDAMVKQIHDAIAAGDSYQCNLTIRLSGKAEGDLDELYRDLAFAQQGGHAAMLDTGRYALLSASPELFFEWTDEVITVRPMKGTATRGRWPIEDQRAGETLRASLKERAENVMIVDLLRNDLGRIAQFGSTKVDALFELERFETVWQLTSTISARPRQEIGLVEVMGALFPCGSVTGAPKISTMALIASLEHAGRGPYCGAVGLLAPPGASFRARFSVAIRTLVIDKLSHDAIYGAGGAITWDSTSAAEHAELLSKTAILFERRDDFMLFETMALLGSGQIRDQVLHLARLRASAHYFGFHYDESAIKTALRRVVLDNLGPLRLRLSLERNGAIHLEAGPMPTSSALVSLELDAEPTDSNDVFVFHKTTRRAGLEKRARRHPDADQVVLLNERGELTETTIANLMVRLSETWWTPPISAGLLAGTARARLISDGLVRERTLYPEDLQRAEDLAVVNSLRGWTKAVLRDLT